MNFCTIIALELTSKKKKFAGIINPEEDTLNIWNQHQLHQGETQSQTHHCTFMCLIAYKMHCIYLFAYHYHMRVSFLDILGSSLHGPRHASRSLLCVSKNCPQMAIQYFPHNTFHKTHFVSNSTFCIKHILFQKPTFWS